MRLWTLHPRYLDTQGLTASWREGLLARAVLHGQTRGYRHHPQLFRFQAHAEPLLAIDGFLHAVHAESLARGYRFDATKLGPMPTDLVPIEATSGQLAHEWGHLMAKLQARSPDLFERWRTLEAPHAHPLFVIVEGPIAPWERA